MAERSAARRRVHTRWNQGGSADGSQTPPIIDCRAYYSTGIYTEINERLSQNVDMPPRAAWISARFVGIAFVFEFQVEAEPMHSLENFIRLCVLLHRQVASDTDDWYGRHDVPQMFTAM